MYQRFGVSLHDKFLSDFSLLFLTGFPLTLYFTFPIKDQQLFLMIQEDYQEIYPVA